MSDGFPFLCPENAWIFRITHFDNVRWILEHGLHCRNGKQDPNFVGIGNRDLIGKRGTQVVDVDPGGTLSDYVPFYFTPRSPMLLNIKTGRNVPCQRPMSDLVIMVASLHQLAERGIQFLFTDRHACLKAAKFKSDLCELGMVDWRILQTCDFKRSMDDLEKVERYQAEALVHRMLPIDALLGIACHNRARQEELRSLIKQVGCACRTSCNPEWYF
jgi:hypothetical protein